MIYSVYYDNINGRREYINGVQVYPDSGTKNEKEIRWEKPVEKPLPIKIPKYCKLPEIDKVIFNDPATIVFWADGTKTIAKCTDEEYDKEKGMMVCMLKKCYGPEFFEVVKDWAW